MERAGNAVWEDVVLQMVDGEMELLEGGGDTGVDEGGAGEDAGFGLEFNEDGF